MARFMDPGFDQVPKIGREDRATVGECGSMYGHTWVEQEPGPARPSRMRFAARAWKRLSPDRSRMANLISGNDRVGSSIDRSPQGGVPTNGCGEQLEWCLFRSLGNVCMAIHTLNAVLNARLSLPNSLPMRPRTSGVLSKRTRDICMAIHTSVKGAELRAQGQRPAGRKVQSASNGRSDRSRHMYGHAYVDRPRAT